MRMRDEPETPVRLQPLKEIKISPVNTNRKRTTSIEYIDFSLSELRLIC